MLWTSCIKVLMAGRNLPAYAIFIAPITCPSQTQILRGTKETLNMHLAQARLHSVGPAASGGRTWNPGSLGFLVLGHCSGKAPETLHLNSSDHRAPTQSQGPISKALLLTILSVWSYNFYGALGCKLLLVLHTWLEWSQLLLDV